MCRMAFSTRQTIIFVLGLVLGVLAGAMALNAWFDEQRIEEAAAEERLQQQAKAAVPTGPACAWDALITSGNEKDAQFTLATDVIDKTASDVLAYQSVAADMRNNGRVRDAEVALITSCRIAAQVVGADSGELADAKYQLARHYAMVAAARGAMEPAGKDQLARAETLFNESMQLHTARLGSSHEKTRLAAAGVTLAKQAVALAAMLPLSAPLPDAAVAAASAPVAASSATVATATRKKPKAEPEAEAVRDSEPASDTSVMGAAPEPKKRRPRVAPAEPQPREPVAATGRADGTESPAYPVVPPGLPNEVTTD
jgi:hypothetical protein